MIISTTLGDITAEVLDHPRGPVSTWEGLLDLTGRTEAVLVSGEAVNNGAAWVDDKGPQSKSIRLKSGERLTTDEVTEISVAVLAALNSAFPAGGTEVMEAEAAAKSRKVGALRIALDNAVENVDLIRAELDRLES